MTSQKNSASQNSQTARIKPGPLERAGVCSQEGRGSHLHSPSHRTSPHSHSLCHISTCWGCSGHSHSGTESTESSLGLPWGFLRRSNTPGHFRCTHVNVRLRPGLSPRGSSPRVPVRLSQRTNGTFMDPRRDKEHAETALHPLRPQLLFL